MPQIIPKIERKSFVEKFLFPLSIVLLLIAMGSYLVLSFLEKKIPEEIEKIETEIAKAKGKRIIKIENQLKNTAKLLNNFSQILEKRTYPSRFLSPGKGSFEETKKFSSLIHPRVQILTFSLDLEKNQLNISGITDNFVTLEQQRLIFKSTPLIENVKLTNFSNTEDGRLNFTFEVYFNPGVFR